MVHSCGHNIRAGKGLRWRVLLVSVLAAVVAPLVLVGEAGASAVVVVDGGLNPAVMTVQVGTTVTWQFADANRHRIRSTTDAQRFDSGNQTGSSFSVTFGRAGTFPYVDEEHDDVAGYQGTIVVVESAPATTPPPTTPAPTVPGPTVPGPTVPGPTSPGPTAPPPTNPPPPAPASVRIVGRSFSPSSITVTAGSTVTWRNDDKDRHTVTHTGGAFDSGTFSTGGTYVRTFTTAGTFSYFCDLHTDMVGRVVVNPGGGNPPPPAPTTTVPGGPTTTTIPGASTVPPTTQPGSPPVGANTVRMVDFAFQPLTLTVKAGDTVTWTNAGQARHNVAANDGSFHSPDVRAGQSYQRAFPTAGSYAYFCDFHPEMTGVIAVTGSGGEPPPPPPPPPPTTPVTASGDVRMADFSFAPRSITITAGRTLTFVNTGAARHSATARDGSFDTGLLGRGASGRVRFPVPGTFEYFCSIHPNMSGTVLVTGADGAPPPPPVERPVTPVATGDVRMVDFDYEPREINVTAGATVGFVNAGVAPHTATAVDGSFDTGLVRTGRRAPITFTTAGTFPIYCTIHPDMTATVLVTDASGAPPPPPAETPAAPAGAEARAEVTVFAASFEPAEVRVAQGGTVTWTVSGADPHIIEADDGSFLSGIIISSTPFEFTFDEAGTWSYDDKLHPEVTGTVVVVPEASAGSSADEGPSVSMIDNAFEPQELTVTVGDEVRWTNDGRAAHTIAAGDGSWASDLVAAGGEFSRRFDTVGTYEYVCTLHSEMTGTILVEPPTAAAAPPPAAPSAGTDGTGNRAGYGVGALVIGALVGMLLATGSFVIGRRWRPAAL
jgi:plastocyanin